MITLNGKNAVGNGWKWIFRPLFPRPQYTVPRPSTHSIYKDIFSFYKVCQKHVILIPDLDYTSQVLNNIACSFTSRFNNYPTRNMHKKMIVFKYIMIMIMIMIPLKTLKAQVNALSALVRHWCLVAKKFEIKKFRFCKSGCSNAQHFTIDERR